MNKRRRKKLMKKYLDITIDDMIQYTMRELYLNTTVFGFAGLEMTEDGPRVLSYEEAEKLLQEIEEEN